MSWKIEDLDKNKTEQAISNETARLDMCRKKLEEYNKRYEYLDAKYNKELNKITTTIESISKSIIAGEKFIKDCQHHLDTDF